LAPVKERPAVRPYAQLLAERGWVVHNHSVDGGTVRDIERAAALALASHRPTAIVIQVGIVDCAPRPLAFWERELLSHVRPDRLRNRIVAFLHEHRAAIIARRRLIQSTPLPEFTQSLERLAERCLSATSHVAALPIFPATSEVLARNPLLRSEIDKYNDAMRRWSERLRFFEVKETVGETPIESLAATPESVHLNQRGHELVAEALCSWLKGLP